MEKLNIKRNLIGSKVFHVTLNKYILIEKGNEELYEKLGMDVFTKRRKPKLQKNNDKNTKKRNNDNNSNTERINDD